MKIGFDAKRFFHNKTGLGNYSRDLIRIISTFYPDHLYFLFTPKLPKNYTKTNNAITLAPKGVFKKLKSIWRSYFIKNDIKKSKIDIFHGLSGEIPFGVSKNVKLVVTIHDLIFVRYPNLYSFWDRKIHYYKFKFASKRADLIIAISEQTKLDIIDFLKIPSEKIQVVYQGCSPAFKEIYSNAEKETVISKFNLPSKFILNVGTIEPRKNALSIVKAIKNTEIKLVLIGKKTKYFDEIQLFEKEHKMDNLLHLSNVSQKELAIIYQLATVFVYPSIFEGFGIPIIEALFSKTPVITTNSGVFPEAGGENSIYVNPYNIEELSEKIKLLYFDSDLRTKISNQGIIYAEKFLDENIAKNIIDLYNKLLHESHSF